MELPPLTMASDARPEWAGAGGHRARAHKDRVRHTGIYIRGRVSVTCWFLIVFSFVLPCLKFTLHVIFAYTKHWYYNIL